MNEILVTHYDLDGLGCELVYAYATSPHFTKVRRVGYDKLDETCEDVLARLRSGEVERVIFADIAPTRVHLRQINEEQLNVVVLDHHENNDWGKICSELPNVRGAFDNSRCGAMMLAEWVYEGHEIPSRVYNLLRAIQAWDLWLLQDPYRKQGEDLQRLFGFWGWDELLHKLRRLVTDEDNADVRRQITELETTLQKNDSRYIASRVRAAQILKDEAGRSFAWVVADRCTSEVGNGLAKLPDVEYGAIYIPAHSKVELRGTGKVNVGEIARQHGGGGHHNAAGYPVPALEFPHAQIP